MAVAPVVLVWRTSRRGLSGVSWLPLGTALAMTLVFPSSQLGKAQEQPVGVMLVVLVVWCAAFPAMLRHLDRHYRGLAERHVLVSDRQRFSCGSAVGEGTPGVLVRGLRPHVHRRL